MMLFAIAVVLLGSGASCGYAPRVIERSASQRYCVMSSETTVADANASAALVAGVRQELSRFGALGACPGARTVRVSLRGLSSVPEGIVASQGRPMGRGVRIVAEAVATLDGASDRWRAEGEATVGSSADAWAEAQVQSDGRMSAAKRAGERLARGLLGEPVSGSVMGP